MGIGRKIAMYERSVLEHFGIYYKGLVWCELGGQKRWATGRPAKIEYEKLGVSHTSIDLNGYGGALKLDLDYPVPAEMLEEFDVVTNYGTIEHVNNQYQVFRNVHYMCKIGGLMIHAFPMKDTYEGHCRYYYTENFVNQLSEGCGYSVHDKRILNMSHRGINKNLLVVTLINRDERFVYPNIFNTFDIFDSGDLSRTGNYVQRNRNHSTK